MVGNCVGYYLDLRKSLNLHLLNFKFVVVVNSLCKSATIDYSGGSGKFSLHGYLGSTKIETALESCLRQSRIICSMNVTFWLHCLVLEFALY